MNTFILFVASATTAATLRPAFKNNGLIPVKYTCEGENINPAISVKNIPQQTKSLVLIMEIPMHLMAVLITRQCGILIRPQL